MRRQPSARDERPAAKGSLRKRLARFVRSCHAPAESARSGLSAHAVTYAAVNAGMLLINLLTSPDFLWFLFPLGAWGIGLLNHIFWALGVPLGIHYAKARSQRKRLRRKLEQEGVDLESAADLASLPAGDPEVLVADASLLAEAAKLRESILADLRAGGAEAERWRTELQPELDTYTSHIDTLLQARRDLERAEARVSAAEVTQELAALRGKLENASSPDLRREYRTAVEQYVGQLKTLQDLQERREMIDLRAKSAVLALQQLSLDIPRLRAAPTGESAALLSLRDKTQELTHYLEDLRAGHHDLERAGIR